MDASDYLKVIQALKDIPFAVGKKLLIDFLLGNEDNESIARNGLFKQKSFGTLAYSSDEVDKLIEMLVSHGLIQYTSVQGKKFWKVLELTAQGKANNPVFVPKDKRTLPIHAMLTEKISPVTDDDKKIFQAFGTILEQFNDEQKKVILSNNKHILCIAGAGSGKTTVLTKRIEFLINFKSVPPSKILAITFTRKARTEMVHRLESMTNTSHVQVETFNSFCEQLLKTHNNALYSRDVRVITYAEKFMVLNKALARLGTTLDRAVNAYFTPMQRRLKTHEQLTHIFMNDCFFIRDYMKLKVCDVKTLGANNHATKLVFDICAFIDSFMESNGMRDFADQLIDVITLFTKHPDLIPKFDHILIDEYQDVNATQIRIVDMLDAPYVFAVGDPRQSIYGWRGSDIRYLLNFSVKYPDAQLLLLTENYRSTPAIVTLINESIKEMGLADLQSCMTGTADVHLLQFGSEDAEFEFVIQKIIASNISRKEIFILARTNRQLTEVSALLHTRRIGHVIRSDELRKSAVAQEGDITLATIHAIKGLEAQMVFVIGCTSINFPCRGTEHPIVELVKLEEYDKEAEELRLFYVAMSRAKKTLFITYSGSKHTPYITPAMRELLDEGSRNNYAAKQKPLLQSYKFKTKKANNSSAKILAALRSWRFETSRREGKPAYMVLHDASIQDLAEKLPMTLQDLQKVHGLGPSKINQYGEDILDIVNN